MPPASPAHIILQAVGLAAEADISSLQQLVAHHSQTIGTELALRILLTYLPESTEPRRYTGFLRALVSGSLNPLDDDSGPTPTTDLSEIDARRQVRKLRLLPLVQPLDGTTVDPFTAFLLDKAYRIDVETGSLLLSRELIEPFLEHSQHIRTWAISCLLPLLRLDYEYYPQPATACSLEAFERLQGRAAVDTLLSRAMQKRNAEDAAGIGRDLRGLVGPWMYGGTSKKRRKLSNQANTKGIPDGTGGDEVGLVSRTDFRKRWADVNDWLLALAEKDFPQAVRTLEQWDGPQDVDYGGWNDGEQRGHDDALEKDTVSYAQAALASVVITKDCSPSSFEGIHTILSRVSQLVGLPSPPEAPSSAAGSDAGKMLPGFLASLSPTHLLRNHLLDETNLITMPSNRSLALFYFLVSSALLIHTMGHPMSIEAILILAVFGSVADQREALRRLVHGLQMASNKEDRKWSEIREQLLWLRDWNCGEDQNSPPKPGVFSKVSRVELEDEILKTLLYSSRMIYWLSGRD
jgi:hypothetical protein